MPEFITRATGNSLGFRLGTSAGIRRVGGELMKALAALTFKFKERPMDVNWSRPSQHLTET